MRPIRRFAKLLVAAAAAALSHQIRGDDLVYVAPGGDWSVAANWSEQYVPATGDTTNLPGSGTMNTVITFDNAAPVVNLSSNTIDYTGAAGGSVTFSQSVNSFSTTVEYIGFNGTGLMSLTGGTHTISGAGTNALYVGYNAGSSGTVTLNGNNASLIATDSVYVGYSGTGVFNQFAGTHLLGGYLVLGGEPTGTAIAGTGTYNFTGGSLTVNTLYAGLSGNGNFIQTGGSTLAGGLTSGYLPGSSGTVSLGGSANMDVTGAMTIGDQGNGVFSQSGGFELNSGLIVGNSAGGFGTMVISGGTMWSEGVTVLGSRGNATVLQNGGTYNQYENLFLAVAAGGVANYSLSNGGTLHVVSSTVNGTTYFGGEYIGDYGPATFNQSGGSHIVDVYFYLGAQPGGSGTYNLSGGTLSCPAQNIGGGGTANDVFNQSGGVNTANSYIALGWLGGTQGTYNLSGGTVTVGGLYDGYKGLGSFSQSSGTVNTGQLYLGYSQYSTGYYTLAGGSLNTSSSETIGYQGTGIFTQTGGTHTVAGTATVTLSGTTGGVGTYNLQGGKLSAGPMVNNGAFNLTGGTATLGALSGTGATTITGAALVQPLLTVSKFAQQSVSINSYGKLAVTSSSQAVTNTATSLNITGAGQLDLGNNSLITSASSSSIRSYLINGYKGGAWNGTGGITSANAATNAIHATALGYTTGTSAAGMALGLSSGQTLVKYTIYGDANLDGKVDISDLDVIISNYLSGKPATWDTGDFAYAGRTDITDLNYVLSNFFDSAPSSVRAANAAKASASTASAAQTLTSTVSPADTVSPPPASGVLELVVNVTSGDVELEGNNADIASLQITSANGGIITANWTDLHANGYTNWSDTAKKKTGIGEYDNQFTATGDYAVLGVVDYGDIYNTSVNAEDYVFKYGSVESNDTTVDTDTGSVLYVGVPEPTTLSLMGLAAAGLFGRRRRRR